MSLARRSGGGGGSSSSLTRRPEWVGTGAHTLVAERGDQTAIHLTATAQDHVNAYLEYTRIVGDADGGTLFTDEEYAAFRANAIATRANRLYVAWRCLSSGIDCRQVGPTSPCFCGHRYKQHATDNVSDKAVFCRQPGCACKCYSYVPVRGTQDVKCTCKHSYDVHAVNGKRKCKTGGCPCAGFYTSLSCSCREPYSAHTTVFETREERLASGRPVDNLAGGGAGYEALGGLTSFSSLVDGIDRMAIGPSGEPELVGAPSSSSASLPPVERKKLQAEDEFALYEAKYKKGGSAASSVSRRIGATAAASRAAPPAAALQPYDEENGAGAYDGGGGRALQLFHTPHTLSASSSNAVPPRNRLAAGSSSSTIAPRRAVGATAAPMRAAAAPSSSSSMMPPPRATTQPRPRPAPTTSSTYGRRPPTHEDAPDEGRYY